MKQKLDIDDLVVSAGDLESALMGLSSFVFNKFSGVEGITRNDINGLNGLVRAVDCLAKEHYKTVESFDGGINHE